MPRNIRGTARLLCHREARKLVTTNDHSGRSSEPSVADLGTRRRRFAGELRRRRVLAGLSQRQLGEATFVSRELVTKIEASRRWPGGRFVQAADQLLNAGGELMGMWSAGDAERIEEHRREAIEAQIERLRASVRSSDDIHLRQVLQLAAGHPAKVAPEVATAAVVGLGELVTRGLDRTLAVRRVTELARRVSSYERGDLSGDGLAGVCQLALEIADATQLLAQVHDQVFGTRIAMLVERMRRVLVVQAASLGLADTAAVWGCTPGQDSDLSPTVADPMPGSGDLAEFAAGLAETDDEHTLNAAGNGLLPGHGTTVGGHSIPANPHCIPRQGRHRWRGTATRLAVKPERLRDRPGDRRRRRASGPWGEVPRVRGPSCAASGGGRTAAPRDRQRRASGVSPSTGAGNATCSSWSSGLGPPWPKPEG